VVVLMPPLAMSPEELERLVVVTADAIAVTTAAPSLSAAAAA
jgi:adenosylmethionine-8-amino-7-oxononanoate aminotransferase